MTSLGRIIINNNKSKFSKFGHENQVLYLIPLKSDM